MEKTVEVYRPLAIYKDVFCNSWIIRKGWKDVLLQSIQINDCSYMKKRKEKNSSLYKDHKLFLSEDWYEAVRVNYGIISILFFRIDVSLSSKSIWFGAKITKMKPDDKIELKEVLGLPYLPLGQYLGSRKILKIFIICNNINKICQTL